MTTEVPARMVIDTHNNTGKLTFHFNRTSHRSYDDILKHPGVYSLSQGIYNCEIHFGLAFRYPEFVPGIILRLWETVFPRDDDVLVEQRFNDGSFKIMGKLLRNSPLSNPNEVIGHICLDL